MTTKKKTVKRPAKQATESKPVAEIPAPPPPPPIPVPVSVEEVPTSGPVQYTADPQRKLFRTQQMLSEAEDKAAGYAAVCDQLLEENGKLKTQVKQLTEHVQNMEQELFAQREESDQSDEPDEPA